MILYPAVDLLEGQVVRLIEGDFEQKTVFTRDPKELFAEFYQAGARYAHLVDLSGARHPEQRQKELLQSILKSTFLKVQVGGGIRLLTEIADLIDSGADRVVIGSMIISDPKAVHTALRKFGPERLTFALDVRIQNGVPTVMTKGWTESSGLSLQDALKPFLQEGVQRVLCTDIAVDGRLTGPNVELYRQLIQEFPDLQIQASGGVESAQDLKTLAQTGVHSAVVGRALLSGKISIHEGLQHAQ